MPVDESLVGRSYRSPEPYAVTSEKVREFVVATQGTYDGSVPPTFPIVVAFPAMQALLDDPDTGLALHRVVHGEQRFAYTRPVREGDRLSALLEVVSLRQIGGADIIGTRTTLSDETGATVCEAEATLVHSGEPS